MLGPVLGARNIRKETQIPAPVEFTFSGEELRTNNHNIQISTSV